MCMNSKKSRTKNPFSNNGFSHQAWQDGYDSNAEEVVQNPYDKRAADLHQFWERGRAAKIEDVKAIPEGIYCHGVLIPDGSDNVGRPKFKNPHMCPYWSKDPKAPDQESGRCSFMDKKDGDDGVFLLWDQVKECGIKDTDDE